MDRLVLIVLYIVSVFVEVEQSPERRGELNLLNSQYQAALHEYKESNALEPSDSASHEERIESSMAWPGWEYLPKYLALAKSNPKDEIAWRSCRWILGRCQDVGVKSELVYEADSVAWEMIAKHHDRQEEISLLCLQAPEHPTLAREKFLRDLPEDWTQTVDVHGHAILSLAELLAHRYELVASGEVAKLPESRAEIQKHWGTQISLKWKEYMTVADPEQIRSESCKLFQEVLDQYADVPLTVCAPIVFDVKTLGDRARKELRALQNLRSGQPASTIVDTNRMTSHSN